MQVKNGIDLIEISRLQKALDTFGDRFLNRVYDPSEISLFFKKESICSSAFFS
jgi:phosphopantetheinyl transferase (holo-ACP synthase)